MDLFSIAIFIGIIFGILYPIYKALTRKRLEKEFFLLKSLQDLKEISTDNTILLYGERVPAVSDSAARKNFLDYFLPKIIEDAEKSNVKICYSNLKRSNIDAWLFEKESIKGKGIFIIRNNELLNYKLTRNLIKKDTINSAIELIQSASKE